MTHIDVLKILEVFFKEKICCKITYFRKFSAIEL